MAVWLIFIQVSSDSLLQNFFGAYGIKVSIILGMLMLVIPMIMIRLMKEFNVISSFEMKVREERQLVYTVVAALYLLNYMMLTNLSVPGALRSAVLSVMFTLIFLAAINRFYKVSAHMAGVGGVLGMLIFYLLDGQGSVIFFLMTIMLAGIIASSRLYLDAHTNGQLILGLLIGLIVTFFIFLSQWLPVFG